MKRPSRTWLAAALASAGTGFAALLDVRVAWAVAAACTIVALLRREAPARRERRAPAAAVPQGSPEPPPPQRRFQNAPSTPPSTRRMPALPADSGPVDWKRIRSRHESENGASLSGLLETARRALGCRTVALLLPGREPASAVLRAWSTDRDDLRPGAVLDTGSGLIGSLLKSEAPATLLEPELPPSARLGLYEGESAPRSLAAARFSVGPRAALALADHDAPLPATTLETLASLGETCGLLLSRAEEVRTEARVRELLQVQGRTERALAACGRLDEAHEKLREFLEEFLHADGILFIAPESLPEGPARPSDRWHARVQWCVGEGFETAREFRFDVPGRGLCAGALARGDFLQRKLSDHEMHPFLGPGEPVLPLAQGGEALCAPVNLGVEGRPALLAAWSREQSFGPLQREILETALAAFGQTLRRLQAAVELERLATRDGLTGLLNHRTFQASFRRELLKARRTGSNVAMILTDIDFFKKVNDNHGHPAGDAVLRQVAERVRAQLRDEVDIVARYGGEEFACVLVGTSEQGAVETAERIRRAVEEGACDIGEPQPLKVTMSLGVAVFPVDGGTAEDLIERTDQALYRAKHGGRNRVERALSPARRPEPQA